MQRPRRPADRPGGRPRVRPFRPRKRNGPDADAGPGGLKAMVRALAWVDVAPDLVAALSLDPALATRAAGGEWALVLAARLVPHRLEHVRRVEDTPGPAVRLLVPPAFAERAVDELVQYVEENRFRLAEAPPAPAPIPRPDVLASLLALLGLTLFSTVAMGRLHLFGLHRLPWDALGVVDSRAVLAGEWWRLATGLTLHADGAHLLSNVAIGGVFVLSLVRELRAGPAWLLAVASGVAGNALNCVVLGPGHLSIGASTAVFGVVGLLSGLRALRGQRIGGSVFLPVAAGLTLLALLGSGGGADGPADLPERIDLGAHLFGFVAGLGLGGLAGALVNRRGLPGPGLRTWCGAVAVCLVAGAWVAAFRAM